MIINIPLEINEASFEQKVRDDYMNKVEQLLLDLVMQNLKEADDRYWSRDRDYKYGLRNIIQDRIDVFLEDHKDDIISAASDKLAERLARTKKAKEILEKLEV